MPRVRIRLHVVAVPFPSDSTPSSPQLDVVFSCHWTTGPAAFLAFRFALPSSMRRSCPLESCLTIRPNVRGQSRGADPPISTNAEAVKQFPETVCGNFILFVSIQCQNLYIGPKVLTYKSICPIRWREYTDAVGRSQNNISFKQVTLAVDFSTCLPRVENSEETEFGEC